MNSVKTLFLADAIVERRAADARPEQLADVLERLAWLMADDGNEIVEVASTWLLELTDAYRVQVALSFREFVLCGDIDTLEVAYTRAAEAFPGLAGAVAEARVGLVATRSRR
jgi:hypothetical protein